MASVELSVDDEKRHYDTPGRKYHGSFTRDPLSACSLFKINIDADLVDVKSTIDHLGPARLHQIVSLFKRCVHRSTFTRDPVLDRKPITDELTGVHSSTR